MTTLKSKVRKIRNIRPGTLKSDDRIMWFGEVTMDCKPVLLCSLNRERGSWWRLDPASVRWDSNRKYGRVA